MNAYGLARVLAAALATVLLVACAGGGAPGGDAGEPASTGGTVSSGPSSTAPRTRPDPTGSTKAPRVEPSTTSPAPRELGPRVVTTGRLQEGVEAGCTLLVSDEGPTYLLLHEDLRKLIPPGARRVRVVGVVLDNVASHCMQGQPLEVVSIERA